LMAGRTFDTAIAATKAVLTDPSAFRLIGKRVPREDIPSIATGTATYAQNVRVPGMLHGRVARPPGPAAPIAGATLLSFGKGSSNYGHNTYDDVSISAALRSQAVGKPVRVQFMRWDEHGWDQFGPAQATDVRAGIDANGKLVAYDYSAFNHGWTQVVESSAQLAGVPLPAVAPVAMIDIVSSGSFYKLPNRRVTSNSVNGYGPFMKGTFLRAPGAPQALFASEQTIDALAHAAKMDPIAFRIQN